MARIFFTLALGACSLLATDLFFGYWVGDYNEVAGQIKRAARDLDKLRQNPSADDDVLRAAQQELSAAASGHQPLVYRMTMHRWIGIVAVLITVLVNSVSVTYFIGTSRWCKEVSDTYALEPRFAEDSARLKRKTFPFSFSSLMICLAVVVTGGAADPDNSVVESTMPWVTPHHLVALLGSLWIGWSFLVQVGRIGANYEIIEQIVQRVDEIRARADTAGEVSQRSESE